MLTESVCNTNPSTNPNTNLNFNPNLMPTKDCGIFGLTANYQQSLVILLGVPWDPTTSYGGKASLGPEAILQASPQLDLFDLETHPYYEVGFFYKKGPDFLYDLNKQTGLEAQAVIKALYEGEISFVSNSSKLEHSIAFVNQASETLNNWLYKEAYDIINDNKLLAVLGGDHSSPFGAIRAISEKYHGDFGILHIDAHADLRKAYQGFTYSHASIMYNVMHSSFCPKKLVQVGVRDFCQEEFELIKKHSSIHTFFDLEMKKQLASGVTWNSICKNIVSCLPENIYISFDIDGLNPSLCPHTGTPVPGGLGFEEALILFSHIQEAKKQIIGFDLCEVSPPSILTGQIQADEWDGNVGARVAFKLCGWLAKSTNHHVSVSG